MRVCGIAALLLVVLGGAPLEARAPSTTPGEEEPTFIGEVVALYCYLRDGRFGRGWDHADTGKACVRRGSPLALKVDDHLYILRVEHHHAQQRQLMDWLGRTVQVSGALTMERGQLYLLVSHAERVQP